MRLFRGSCGLTPRRRCQPSSGATRSEPVFPTKREGPARGRRRHAVVAEALVPPDAGCSRRDSRRNSVHKCPETAPRGHFGRSVYTPASLRLLATAQQPNSVHKCLETAPRGPILPFVYTIAILRLPTTQAHGPTVYTNAPIRRREAISTDLCTLLRHRPGGDAHAVGTVTQPPTHTSSRSLQHRDELLSILGTMLPGGFRRSLHHLPAVPRRAPRMGSRTPAPFWALSPAGLTPRAPPR